MPSPLRTPKTLPEWIEVDYFRRPGALRRLRRWATLAAFLGCFPLLLVWSFWPRKSVIYQAGPVADAHIFFNEACRACHQGPFQTAERLIPGRTPHPVPDSACRECHPGSLHNDNQPEVPHCVACHREHRGTDGLVHVVDSRCTDCHADLARHDKRQPPAYENVTGFDGHPDFAIWRVASPRDSTQLHFNHQVHLAAEGILTTGGQREHLDCANCHLLDPRGRYYLPVNYQRDCSRCHVLAVQLAVEPVDQQTRQVVERFNQSPAPHEPPSVVRATLRDRLMHLLDTRPKALAELTAPPAGRIPAPPAPEAAPKDRLDALQRYLREVERPLFDGAGGCRYCHVTKDGMPAAQAPDRVPQILQTGIPQDVVRRWLPHGEFDHNSHRLLACTECHAASESKTVSDLLMPHIDSCKRCHNAQIGVRSGCSDCHRYHDRALEAVWKGTQTIDGSLTHH